MENNNHPTQEVTPTSTTPNRFNQNLFLPISILIAAVLVSGTILYTRGMLPFGGPAGGGENEPPAKVKVEVSDSDHMLGSKDAKVTIVEFSDFQCPFCRTFFNDAYAKLKKEYIDTGKVRLIYKHFPLSFHAMATPAANASECAAEQGKFWEMHDKIFQEQSKLGTGTVEFAVKDLKKWAAQIGLKAAQFNSCLDSKKYQSRVDGDTTYGGELQVSGTPTFFINGNRLVGAQPFASFQNLIDKEL